MIVINKIEKKYVSIKNDTYFITMNEETEFVNGCELPSNFYELDSTTQTNLINYLQNLNKIEVKAYNIAKEHLKTSFNILRSNGYVKWLNNQNQNKK